MEKANKDIRAAIAKKGLYYYEVADELGLNRCYFSTLLRYELPPGSRKRKKILNAIKSISI